MKRNPEQIGQRLALELGRMWIAYLAIRKGVRWTMKWSPAPPGSNIKLSTQTNHANPNIWNVHCGCSHAGEGLMVVVAVYTLLDI